MHVVTRSTAVAAFLTLASHLAVAQQQAPKAEEIFARHVAAIGGRDAIMKINSIKTLGTMQITAMGMTAAIETIIAAPNRVSSKSTIAGIGEIATGFDGTTAWEVNPMQGPRIKSEKETKVTMEEADFYGSLLYSKDRYSSTETVGAADFGGEKTWQVKTVLKSGRVVNEYFSVATGLRVGSRTTQESPKGILDVTAIESDYKKFGDLLIATRSEMQTGSTTMIMTVSNIVFDDASAASFALPAQIKALVSVKD